jgi:superfamily II DNA or RNA helicase
MRLAEPRCKLSISEFACSAMFLIVQTMASQMENLLPLNQVAVPDLWQQQAVAALRAGQDVVVQAPTGAGKTLIFELWSNKGKSRGQAIYTVPTRALANDKLAEWRAQGWDVGISTGDLSENLDAPVLVATLETQKGRLIQGRGPGVGPERNAAPPAQRQRGQPARCREMAASPWA